MACREGGCIRYSRACVSFRWLSAVTAPVENPVGCRVRAPRRAAGGGMPRWARPMVTSSHECGGKCRRNQIGLPSIYATVLKLGEPSVGTTTAAIRRGVQRALSRRSREYRGFGLRASKLYIAPALASAFAITPAESSIRVPRQHFMPHGGLSIRDLDYGADVHILRLPGRPNTLEGCIAAEVGGDGGAACAPRVA